MNNLPLVVTDDTFKQQVLESELPVFADFWAPWCGPCRIVSPVVEELAREYDGRVKVVKINTDENQEIASAYGIMSIPTLAMFKGGKLVDGIIGAAPKKTLKELLDKHAVQPVAN